MGPGKVFIGLNIKRDGVKREIYVVRQVELFRGLCHSFVCARYLAFITFFLLVTAGLFRKVRFIDGLFRKVILWIRRVLCLSFACDFVGLGLYIAVVLPLFLRVRAWTSIRSYAHFVY